MGINYNDKLRNSRKGYMISDSIIMPLSLIIVGIMIFFSSSLVSAQERDFQTLTPNISYEYPKSVIFTFLNYPLNSTTNILFFGDDNPRFVYDLLWLNTVESQDESFVYREKFLSEFDFDKQIELYNSFSGFDFKNDDKFINIDSAENFRYNLQSYVFDGNYYFLIPTKDGLINIVEFYSK